MQEFIECYSTESPDTLVFLRRPDRILKKLYITTESTVYIWIQDPTSQYPDSTRYIESLAQKLKSEIFVVKSEAEAKELVEDNCNRRQKIVIISSKSSNQINEGNKEQTMNKQSHKSKEKDKDEDEDFDDLIVKRKQHFFTKQNYKQKLMVKNNKESEVLPVLEKQKQFHSNMELPNFISIDSEVLSSNMLIRTIFAMVKQKICKETRRQIIGHLEKLMKKITSLQNKFRDIQDFLHEMETSEELKLDRAIYWYTKDSPVYALMNNLLRSTRHPAEIYYMQPFFRDIYNAVKRLSQKQVQENKHQQFVCHRGGLIFEKQVNELRNNSIFQNLQFFSASLNPRVALNYVKNALFEVSVKNSPEVEKLSPGYGLISQYSRYQGEDEVLFNPLNSFKVTSVQKVKLPGKQEEIYKIKLEYGQLQKLMKKPDEYLSSKQRFYKALGWIQNQEQQRISCQGNVLVEENHQITGSYAYWLRYCQLAKTVEQQEVGLLHKALAERLSGDYPQAISTYLEYEKLVKKHFGSNSIKYAEYLNSIAVAYQCQHDDKKALQCYENSLSIKQETLGKNHVDYASTLGNISQIYKNQGIYKVAQQCLNEQRAIYKEVLGECHPDYASTLNNLAIIHELKGELNGDMKLELNKAKELYQECLTIQSAILGKNHPNHAAALANMGIVQKNMGNYGTALQNLQKSLKIYKEASGETHPHYASTLASIGSVYFQQKQLATACVYYEQAKKIQQKSKCKNLDYVFTLTGLAAVKQVVGRYTEANQLLQSALAIQKQILGEQHADCTKTMHKIIKIMQEVAKEYEERGDISNAINEYSLILQLQKQTPGIGTSHIDYADTLYSIGKMYDEGVPTISNLLTWDLLLIRI